MGAVHTRRRTSAFGLLGPGTDSVFFLFFEKVIFLKIEKTKKRVSKNKNQQKYCQKWKTKKTKKQITECPLCAANNRGTDIER